MSNIDDWAKTQQEKLNRIHCLINEVILNHKKIQSLLSEATVKSQTERGLKEIEGFLSSDNR